MYELKVPTQDLLDTAEEMLDLSEDCEDIFWRIGNVLEMMKLDGQWVGEDVDALILSNEANRKIFGDVLGKFEKMAKKMKDYAADMAEKDRAVHNKLL